MHSNNGIFRLKLAEMNCQKDLAMSIDNNIENKADSLNPCKRKIKPLKPVVLLRRNSGTSVYPVACKHFKTKETVIPIKPDNSYGSSKISTKICSGYNHRHPLTSLEQKSASNNKRKKSHISKLASAKNIKKYVTKSATSSSGKTKVKNINVSITYPSKSCGFKPKLFTSMKTKSMTPVPYGSTSQEALNKSIPSSIFQQTKSMCLNQDQGHSDVQACSAMSNPMTSNAFSNPCESFRQSEPIHPNFTDDSLTNITWLGQMGINHFMPIPLERTMKFYKIADKCTRPPYSYMVLIQFAINSSHAKRMTLKEIYQWIEDTFPYFKSAKPGWKNSIRHNLSLHDIFIREVSSNAKSSYWTLKEDISNGSNLLNGNGALRSMSVKPFTPGPQILDPRMSYDGAFSNPNHFQQERVRVGSFFNGDGDNRLIRGKFNHGDMGPMLCDSSVSSTTLQVNSIGNTKQRSDLQLMQFDNLRNECSLNVSTVCQESSAKTSKRTYDTTAPVTDGNVSKLLDDFDSPLKSLFFTGVDSSTAHRLEKYRWKSDRWNDTRTNKKKANVYRNILSSNTSEVVMPRNGSGDGCLSQQVVGNNIGRLFSTNSSSCYNQAFTRPHNEDGFSKQGSLFETTENREPFLRDGKLSFCGASGDGISTSRKSLKSNNDLLKNITSPFLNISDNLNSRYAQNFSTTMTSSKPTLAEERKEATAIFPLKMTTCKDAFSIDSSCSSCYPLDYDQPLGGFDCGTEPLDTSFSKLLDISGGPNSLECQFPSSLHENDDLHWSSTLNL